VGSDSRVRTDAALLDAKLDLHIALALLVLACARARRQPWPPAKVSSEGLCERPRSGRRTLPLEAAPAAARHVGERARRGRRAAGRRAAARLKAARRTERLPARLRGARVEPGVRRRPPVSGDRALPCIAYRASRRSDCGQPRARGVRARRPRAAR